MTKAQGEGVHIGIVDSLGGIPDTFESILDFVEIHNEYVTGDALDPTGHGTTVTGLIADSAERASFSLFQTFGPENSGSNRGEAAQAIVDAGSAGVDVLNLSIGKMHECGGSCTLSRETELVVAEDDVCAVAATGNQDQTSERHGVACPALLDCVVGVGGYIPACTHDALRDDTSGQWWVENGDNMYGPYCGQQNCCPGEGCEMNRNEHLWKGNVSFHNTVPDTLAPVVEVHTTVDDEIVYQAGTSFAAPLVTGIIANVLSMLGEEANSLSVTEIREAVQFSGSEIDDSEFLKLDMHDFAEELSDGSISAHEL